MEKNRKKNSFKYCEVFKKYKSEIKIKEEREKDPTEIISILYFR